MNRKRRREPKLKTIRLKRARRVGIRTRSSSPFPFPDEFNHSDPYLSPSDQEDYPCSRPYLPNPSPSPHSVSSPFPQIFPSGRPTSTSFYPPSSHSSHPTIPNFLLLLLLRLTKTKQSKESWRDLIPKRSSTRSSCSFRTSFLWFLKLAGWVWMMVELGVG